jgi:hypothetical protein
MWTRECSYTRADMYVDTRVLIYTGRYVCTPYAYPQGYTRECPYTRVDMYVDTRIRIFTSAFEFTHAHTSIHLRVNFTPERSRVFTYEFLYKRAPSYKTHAGLQRTQTLVNVRRCLNMYVCPRECIHQPEHIHKPKFA